MASWERAEAGRQKIKRGEKMIVRRPSLRKINGRFRVWRCIWKGLAVRDYVMGCVDKKKMLTELRSGRVGYVFFFCLIYLLGL